MEQKKVTIEALSSTSGNRTPVTSVTARYTDHYTKADDKGNSDCWDTESEILGF